MGHTSEFNVFVELHKNQLVSSGIPERYWTSLYNKIRQGTFDSGSVFQLIKIGYDEERETHEPVLALQAITDIDKNDPRHIYIIDHFWTFRVSEARKQLKEIESIRTRLCFMLDIEESSDRDQVTEYIFKDIWKICNTYSIGNAANVEDRLPVWYVMDEMGTAVMHKDTPNCRVVPFVYVNEQITYSLLFPIENISEEEFLFRDYAEGISDHTQRTAALLPWIPQLFENYSFKPELTGEDYYLSGHIQESLPQSMEIVTDIKTKFKVFTEYSYIAKYLTKSNFELVDNESESDILWYTKHFKDFEKLSTESPQKFVNQFPFEYVLTIKDLLCLTCRLSDKADVDNLTGTPNWLPITYNLKTEIGNFCNYFQHREQSGLENYWIVKPYNLARSLDTHITSNLNYIMRLPATGPKIAQKYISDPVLFQRPECEGAVKFDIRYVILLKSVKPLEAYVHKEFFLRFANQPFSLSDFDIYEKHFTVMNYGENVEMKHMLCSEFKEKWREQYPSEQWENVETSILSMLREILDCASKKEPPCGIAHCPQSRALYAADIMLEWNANREIQPKILEINWTPDCKRACEYYPDFYNDIFSLFFLKDQPEVFLRL